MHERTFRETLTQGTPAFLTWIKMRLDESLKVNVVHMFHVIQAGEKLVTAH